MTEIFRDYELKTQEAVEGLWKLIQKGFNIEGPFPDRVFWFDQSFEILDQLGDKLNQGRKPLVGIIDTTHSNRGHLFVSTTEDHEIMTRREAETLVDKAHGYGSKEGSYISSPKAIFRSKRLLPIIEKRSLPLVSRTYFFKEKQEFEDFVKYIRENVRKSAKIDEDIILISTFLGVHGKPPEPRFWDLGATAYIYEKSSLSKIAIDYFENKNNQSKRRSKTK